MKTLIKLIIGLAVAAGIAYLAIFVPLDKKTLWGHLVGISKTDEAKTLENELEKKVKSTAKNVSKELKSRASELAEVKDKITSGIGETKGQDAVSGDSERSKDAEEKLEIGEIKSEPSESDRQALNRLVKQKNRD